MVASSLLHLKRLAKLSPLKSVQFSIERRENSDAPRSWPDVKCINRFRKLDVFARTADFQSLT